MATLTTLPLRLGSFRSTKLSSTSPERAAVPNAYSMEALTTALTLEPGSVAAHPAYRILYKNNKHALLAFITHAKSLTYEEAGANLDFCNAILEDEKGDDVSYSVINANLTKLRMTSTSTPSMPAILTSIDKLLLIRDAWLQAAVRYFSFDCWYTMVRGYYINHDDPELVPLRKVASKQARGNFLRFHGEFTKPMAQMGYKADLNELRAAYNRAHHDLMSYKRQMQRELGSFRSIHAKIDEHLKKLSQQREAEKKKQKAKLLRRAQLKERTLQTSILQMGQLGSEPMSDDVQDALDEMHETMYQEHLEVKDGEEDPVEKKKFQEWQEEVLSRPYNLDNECKQDPTPKLNKEKKKTYYVISFGLRQGADEMQCMESRRRVHEGAARPHQRYTIQTSTKQSHDPQATNEQRSGKDEQSAKPLDLETWTIAPASILDKDALAWMALNYGQRKVGGIRDVWRAIFEQTGGQHGGQAIDRQREERLKERSRRRLQKRSGSRKPGNYISAEDVEHGARRGS